MPHKASPQSLEQAVSAKPRPPGEDDAAADLFDIFLVLARRKRLVCCVTLASAVLTTVAVYSMPNTFTAVAVIMPPQQPQSMTSALLGQLGPLAGTAGLGLKTPADLYIGLLGTRTVADTITDRFGLVAVYGAKTKTQARNELQERRRFKSGKDSLIIVEVDDTDPKRAALLANAYVEELSRLNNRLAVSDASQRRAFLEARLKQEQAALSFAEQAMKRTQMKTGGIQVDAQSRMAIAAISQLRAQVTAGEVALEGLRMGATGENPEVARAVTELEQLRSHLRNLQASPHSGESVMAVADIPEAGLEYVRSLRDMRYHEYLFEMLSRQYEAASLDEGKAAPALQVLDAAVPPEMRSGPPRKAIILAVSFFSAMLASLVIVFQNQHPAKLHLIKAELLRFSVKA